MVSLLVPSGVSSPGNKSNLLPVDIPTVKGKWPYRY
ncbi:hypothetical protein T06_10356, partial [Trichinella sp. T6]